MPTEKLAKRVYLSDAENIKLEKKLETEGLSASNYFRRLAGFPLLEQGKGRLKNKTEKK